MKNLNKILLIIALNLTFSFSVYSTPTNQFINSVSPPMNANSVVKSSNIVIIFEQTMNGSTMTDANVKVFGYQTGLMNLSLDFNSVANTLTINPVNEFKNGEKISVTLTSGIKTISNQSITPFVFLFRAKALGGTGSFNLSSEISNTVSGYIRSGDIDIDGDIDLVINNAVYINNGNALFNISQTLNQQGRPDIFDADNDNDLDIMISNIGTIYYYKNDGLGNFSFFSTFPGSVWAYGDLSGNGLMDITYFVNTSEVRTAFNFNGNFISNPVVTLFGQCVNNGDLYDNLLIDDYNNDGNMDIMAISGWINGSSITFYDICRNYNLLEKNGIGEFISQDAFYHFSERWSPIIFEAADSKSFDFNDDGLVDIESPILKLNNNSNGLFTETGGFVVFSSSLDFDFNGDGFIDLSANNSGSPLLCYLNDGSGDFSFYIGNNLQFASASASGDFDNDGDIDIAIKEYSNDKVAILLNGDSPLPVELSSFTSSVNSNSVKLNWSTSSEQYNSGFEIQRSIVKNETPDAWTKIGFTDGQGNSNTAASYTFEDKNLLSGKYKYRLKQIDFNGNFEIYDLSNEVVIGIPTSTELMQNYPNPFNPVTNISYRLSENGFVTLKVFDNSGREVKTLINEFKEAGYYTNEFNGSDLASGIYFYKLTAGDFVQTKKLSLVK